MPPLPRDVRRALATKGFVRDANPGRDHEMFFLHIAGKKSAFFMKLSRSARELRRDEMVNSARQVGIAPSDLFKVLSCTYDGAATTKLYQERERLPPPK